MTNPSGLGQPGPDQPDFTGPDGGWPGSPADHAAPPAAWQSQTPGVFGPPPTSPPPGGWPPPQGPAAPGGPPSGMAPGAWGPPPPPTPRRRGRGPFVAVGGAVVVVLAIALIVPPLFRPTPPVATLTPTPARTPATSAAPTVVRTPEPARPTTAVTVSGGGIGQEHAYATGTGNAVVTVSRAVWSDSGVLPPADGNSYLILEVAFRGESGVVPTSPFTCRVVDSESIGHLVRGGAVEGLLPTRVLAAGQTNSGQLAFELVRGPVRLQVLDEALKPVATVEIPG